MYGCESWTIRKSGRWRIDALELWCWRRLESPLDWKIKPVNPKRNQHWIFTGRTYAEAEAEAPILWPPDAKNWLTGQDPECWEDWGQEKGMTENEMVGWHHRLEFEQAPGGGDGQGGLAHCSPWGHKESDTTKRLNWTELYNTVSYDQHLMINYNGKEYEKECV